MRGRWKSLMTDSFIQLAVVLSILRTDLRVYLRQYSQYPEVQQALLGQSVGLHLVDNYHNNDLLPLPPSKYIDDREQIFQDLHRFVESSRVFQQHSRTTLSTWLVTNTSAATSENFASSSEVAQVELSQQDVELIESLWKEDLNLSAGRARFERELENGSGPQHAVSRVTILEPTTTTPINDNTVLPWTANTNGASELQYRPPFNTQNSLDFELEDLVSISPDDVMEPHGATATNSSVLYPEGISSQILSGWAPNEETNNTGVLWGSMQPYDLSRQDSSMNMAGFTDDLPSPSLLEDMDILPDMGIDFDLDPDDMLDCLNGDGDRDSVSVSLDSAVGSSPTHSWSDRASTYGSERHSISSSDPFDLDDGAVGYTKTEPYDDKYYNNFYDEIARPTKNVVSHDHTYGAPHGGVPHVRKMDIKTTKVPSRGLAHDEAMRKKYKIPFDVDTIINSPVDEFNNLLQIHQLSPKQVTLVKDIRRRGKNKVAAQNCRHKRVGEYSGLEAEVDALDSKRSSLYQKHTLLVNKSTQVKKHIDIISTEIFRTLRDENGVPYDTSTFSLEVGGDGEIHVTTTEQNQRRRNSRKRNNSKRRRQ